MKELLSHTHVSKSNLGISRYIEFRDCVNNLKKLL